MDNATQEMRSVDAPRKMENLWQVTAFSRFNLCYTFGYFEDEVQARVFAMKLCSNDNMADSFHGQLVEMGRDDRVWLRPDEIMAIEIDHPYDYEVRNSWWEDQERNGRKEGEMKR